MLREIEAQEEEKQGLREEAERKDELIQQKDDEMVAFREQVQAKDEQQTSEMDQLKLAHSIEVEQVHIQVRDMEVKLDIFKTERETETTEFDTRIRMKDLEIDSKTQEIKTNRREIKVKDSALQEKDGIISSLNNQLTRTREYLTTKQQVAQSGISWKQCSEAPVNMSMGTSTVINGRVYFGGDTPDDKNKYIVYCYDPSEDNWTTLPPLPVKWFGLNGKLVAVGGIKRSAYSATNEVHTYDEQSKKWKQTIPPMPTGRHSPGVLSLQSALVVAGGYYEDGYKDVVEIYKPDTSQWYTTDLLPIACSDISLLAIGNILCYALGGWNGSRLNQALYASVDDLLHKAVPANQTTHSGSKDTQSVWKKLPDTPTYQPTATVLAGNLLAIGGGNESSRDVKKEVYMYSSSADSWIYISDLPTPRVGTKVAALSSTEILVVGGWDGSKRVNSMYRGTLDIPLYYEINNGINLSSYLQPTVLV